MADDTRDVLFQLVPGTGRGSPKSIPSECTALLNPDDELGKKGFTASTKTADANFFSIEDFSFVVALASSDGTAATSSAKVGAMVQETRDRSDEQMKAITKKLQESNIPELQGLKLGAGGGASSTFQRFMTSGRSALRAKTYPSDLDAISITRRQDATSLTLLDACLHSVTFKSATILKRKAFGDRYLRTYLRIDFTDVMLTEFNWEEDDVIKETFKFVCRGAAVQYASEESGIKMIGGKPVASTSMAVRGKGTWSVRDMKSHPGG